MQEVDVETRTMKTSHLNGELLFRIILHVFLVWVCVVLQRLPTGRPIVGDRNPAVGRRAAGGRRVIRFGRSRLAW